MINTNYHSYIKHIHANNSICDKNQVHYIKNLYNMNDESFCWIGI